MILINVSSSHYSTDITPSSRFAMPDRRHHIPQGVVESDIEDKQTCNPLGIYTYWVGSVSLGMCHVVFHTYGSAVFVVLVVITVVPITIHLEGASCAVWNFWVITCYLSDSPHRTRNNSYQEIRNVNTLQK